MIYQNLELHNVSEVQESCLGAVLQRIPEAVRQKLEKRRNFRAEDCPGVEIRFASEAFCIEVVLKCIYGGGMITVYRGPQAFTSCQAATGETLTFHLEPPEEWDALDFGDAPGWARNIWRIQLPPASFALCHVETYGSIIRPPLPDERPKHTLLAYGSSITQGCFAQNVRFAYVQYAADRLGWDVRNLGLSGACFCEPAMADFLTNLSGWDVAFLELGANMRPFFSPDAFRERVEYLLGRLRASHPDKPVLLSTIYPNKETFRREKTLLFHREEAYNQILRDLAAKKVHPKLSLVEGSRLLREPAYLGADQIHPSDYGHARMGENLANLLCPLDHPN